MALLSTRRSIFFKIYAGLLIVCVAVIAFAYFFVNTINEVRLQSYRENMVSGVFYLVGEGYQRQALAQKETWLRDVSKLFGDSFEVVPLVEQSFSAKEMKKLLEGRTVVRYENTSNQFLVFHKLANEEKLLAIKTAQVGDRQARAATIFLLEDLSHYPTIAAKSGRLEQLSRAFGYPLALHEIKNLRLNTSEFERLNAGDTVIAFRDGGASQGSSISVLAPSGIYGTVIVAGPIPVFQWFPLNLLASTALIAILLISLGVYALIFPLERRLSMLQAGVNQVAEGKLDTKVQVVGNDDIARLSSTFNTMTTHIKRLIESQRELTRAVSHELRTPVARIRFAVDMLADTDDAESREMQKKYIDEDIESLNGLIDEILTYAKLEEGSPKLDWEMVNLRALLEQIERETNALGKPIAVKILPPNAKVVAMADKRYLHRVVQNLAGNALRYAKSTVIISAGIARNMAFVIVEDDGQGIPKADREKVFIPFARLDDSRTRASGGYGLGLSIVSRIAFWFNGTMKVDESPALGGARFVMTWPVRQVGVNILADELTQVKTEKTVIGEE
ncbi:MAG: ATP-binding protein [Moraxella sp.]|nr:ATP-binding protein [Moraxella sp.]